MGGGGAVSSAANSRSATSSVMTPAERAIAPGAAAATAVGKKTQAFCFFHLAAKAFPLRGVISVSPTCT